MYGLAAIAHQLGHGIGRLTRFTPAIGVLHLAPLEGSGGQRLEGLSFNDLVGVEGRTRQRPLPVVHHLRHGGGHTARYAALLSMIARLVVVHIVAIGAHVVIGSILPPTRFDERCNGCRGSHFGGWGQRCPQGLYLACKFIEPPLHVLRYLVDIKMAVFRVAQDIVRAVVARHDDKTAVVLCVEHVECI